MYYLCVLMSKGTITSRMFLRVPVRTIALAASVAFGRTATEAEHRHQQRAQEAKSLYQKVSGDSISTNGFSMRFHYQNCMENMSLKKV